MMILSVIFSLSVLCAVFKAKQAKSNGCLKQWRCFTLTHICVTCRDEFTRVLSYFVPFHACSVFMSSEDTSIHSMYAIAHVLICSGIIDYFVSDSGPVSISGGTSFGGISWSLGAARFVFGIVRSLWDLTGTSAAVLPTCLSNCCAIRRFRVPISWLRGFARPCGGASFRMLRRGPGDLLLISVMSGWAC